jgi:hypothetical protein
MWLHDILPGFLIWPTFEGHIGQSSKGHSCWHVSLLFDLEHSNLYIYIFAEFRPDRTSNVAAAILENQQSAITPELMAGSSPNFYHRYMLPRFLIWPTFWRSQRSKFKMEPIWARFITIWPRTFYPCVNMYLGTIYLSAIFRLDWSSNIAARWPSSYHYTVS